MFELYREEAGGELVAVTESLAEASDRALRLLRDTSDAQVKYHGAVNAPYRLVLLMDGEAYGKFYCMYGKVTFSAQARSGGVPPRRLDPNDHGEEVRSTPCPACGAPMLADFEGQLGKEDDPIWSCTQCSLIADRAALAPWRFSLEEWSNIVRQERDDAWIKATGWPSLDEACGARPLAVPDEARQLVRSIATSAASFIAEIDRSSDLVWRYLEQRLIPLAESDSQTLSILKQIAADGRKLGEL